MTSVALKTALTKQLPVLFAYIGWAEHYDGTEPIDGNFSWIKDNPTENWERNAFQKVGDGNFYCGVGRGSVSSTTQLHVVFVARDPLDQRMKVVGIYPAASIVPREDTWTQVRTKNAVLFRGRRPLVASWPGYQGTRRWAWRGSAPGSEHRSLYKFFNLLRNNLLKGRVPARNFDPADPTDPELQAFEGEERKRFIKHRIREARFRREKIREALNLNNGHLICEVPKCKFDFMKRYGHLGGGYAQVHHKKPLGAAAQKGQHITLKDLAVVCANCHAMIHRGGACRRGGMGAHAMD
jgi:hypothetical protein